MVQLLSSKQLNNNIEFCISDIGVGIPNYKLKDLFSFQSTYTTRGTNSEKGSGLVLISQVWKSED